MIQIMLVLVRQKDLVVDHIRPRLIKIIQINQIQIVVRKKVILKHINPLQILGDLDGMVVLDFIDQCILDHLQA